MNYFKKKKKLFYLHSNADATIFLRFYCPWKHDKTTLSKVSHNWLKFSVLPTGPKPALISVSVPWKFLTARLMYNDFDCVHWSLCFSADLSRNYFSTPYLGKVHTWILQWLHALHIYIVKSGIDMLKDKNTHTDVSAQSQFPITFDAKTSRRFCHF